MQTSTTPSPLHTGNNSVEQIQKRLEQRGFRVFRKINYANNQFAIAGHKCALEIDKFGVVDTFCVVGHLSNPTIDDIRAFSGQCFQYARKNRSCRLPPGCFAAYFVYPILIVETLSDDVAKQIENAPVPQHFSAFEFPIVIDRSTNKVHFFVGIASWGFLFFEGCRRFSCEITDQPGWREKPSFARRRKRIVLLFSLTLPILALQIYVAGWYWFDIFLFILISLVISIAVLTAKDKSSSRRKIENALKTASQQQLPNYASLWRRLFACIFDAMLLGFITGLALFLFAHISSSITVKPSTSPFLELANIFYFVLMESWIGKGQTIGKRLFKIHVTRLDGKPLNLLQSLSRFFLFSIIAMPNELSKIFLFWTSTAYAHGIMNIFALLFISSILFTKSKQGLHGYFSKTMVVHKK